MWLIEDRKDRQAINDLFGVFARKQTRDEDELELAFNPAINWACSRPSAKDDDSLGLGKPIAGGTRILLREIGPKDYDLVAAPTTGDAVAFGLYPEGGGSCGVPMSDGFELAAEVQDGSAIVYGLVADEVTSVDLFVDGTKRRARLSENGFALAIPEAIGKALDKLVLNRSDGSATEIP